MNKLNKNVLISVFNKEGIGYLGRELTKMGYNIYASEGTGKVLKKNGVNFTSSKDITGNPDALYDCIQTISYNIPAGILFNRDNKSHIKQIKKFNITPISIIICNFPPISENIKSVNNFNIQNIDVGGPLMVRSAATNFKDTIVVIDTNDYSKLIEQLSNGIIDINIKKDFAIKAFEYINNYNISIISYLKNNNFQEYKY